MAATAGMMQDASCSAANLMFTDGADAQHLNIQPVFIPRQQQTSHIVSQTPGSPNSQADFSVLLRNVAALCSSSGLAMEQQGIGSSPNNLQQDLAALRSSPQIHSSPTLLYSPMATSNGPSKSTYFITNSNNMNGGGDMLSPDPFTVAASNDPNGLAMLSNGNHLASPLSAAAAAGSMGNDPPGVQTLYSSNDQLAMAAAAAAAVAGANVARAAHTQTLLQQQAAAAAGLGSALGSFGSLSSLTSPLGTNSLGKLEESLSGSLYGAGSMTKPVSSSLYIKNLPPDADKLFLYEKFSPYGAILSVKVLNDPTSGQCRGVGFVNFAEHSSAVRSIQALHGTKVGDKLMHVSLQTPRIRASTVQC